MSRTVRKMSLFSTAGVLVALSIGLAQAQTAPATFVPFNDFIQSLNGANSTHFVARTGFQVQDSAAFEEMRQHILSMYNGVAVSHSYVLGSPTFDCIPSSRRCGLLAKARSRPSRPVRPRHPAMYPVPNPPRCRSCRWVRPKIRSAILSVAKPTPSP